MTAESPPSKQDIRKRQILGATLRLLRRHGSGITTAQIAAEARCSKETLYSWFGDRDGIMMALVQEQAKGMNDALAMAFSKAEGTIEKRLRAYATMLLDIMTGEASLAVNRIAMAQTCRESAVLGGAVLKDWNDKVAKPFIEVFHEGNASGYLVVHSPKEAFDNLVGLLVGDRQRRLLLGEDNRPEPAAMAGIATKAVQRWLILYKA